jgi:hypothetical protein
MQDICRSGLLSGCCLEHVLGELTFWMPSYLYTCILLCWINLISCLILYRNSISYFVGLILFFNCIHEFYRLPEGFLSKWLLWSSTIQLKKWSTTPSNTPGFNLSPTTTRMY